MNFGMWGDICDMQKFMLIGSTVLDYWHLKFALLQRLSWLLFVRPYYRSSLWYSVSSVVCLWRFVLWQNGAS